MGIVIVILVIGIAATFLYVWHRKGTMEAYRKIEDECRIASLELNSLCSPYKLFTDAEMAAYAHKYGELLERCKPLIEISYIKANFSTLSVRLFIHDMDHLRERQKKNHDAYYTREEINDAVVAPLKEAEGFVSSFISFSEIQRFRSAYRPLYERVKSFEEQYGKFKLTSPLSGDAQKFASIYAQYESESERKKHNDMYMSNMLQYCSIYFDEMLSYPLDKQQREAIVDLEDNELVIASAGSGKTSTIVGKANYLIDKLGIDPAKILLVTYTAKAAEELRQRINVEGVAAATFHKHALDTLGLITGSRPTLADENLLSSIFLDLLEHDEDFLSWFLRYETSYQNLMKDPFEYETASEYIADLEKYGKLAPYKDMDGHTCFMKSKQEIDIFVRLTEMGLNVRYEEDYKYDTSDSRYRRYKPDFSIHYDLIEEDEKGKRVKKHHVLYLEHFAIDKDSKVPKWFGDGKQGGWYAANERYNEGIVWKKQIHQQYHTEFAYTTSAQFTDCTIYDVLEDIVKRFGIPTHYLSNEERIAKLSRNVKTLESGMKKLISSFVTLMKANRKLLDDVIEQIPEDDGFEKRNYDVLCNIIKPVYEAYQKRLQEDDLYDFTDVLLKAADLCEVNNPYDYDYILVDEFQDMSMDKYVYLKSLRRKDSQRETKLFCVGDDWQSIYRFAGNDMTLFFDYEKFFGFTSKRKIETTHRFGEPLIAASSNFILQNPSQQKKTVRADSKNRSTDIEFLPYLNEADEREILEREIKALPANSSVSILARYNYEIDQLYPNARRHEDDKYPQFKIGSRTVRFMSVHAAKGLEADYIFLVGCRGGINGFPSLVEDDPILKYVLSAADSFENAEERRVFYVAITRARKCAFVLYDQEHRSSFIDEFVNDYSAEELCPRCKNGKVTVVRDGITARGNYYSLVRCNNPYCDYLEPIFYNELEISSYTVGAFVAQHFPISMCEPSMTVRDGKVCWEFDDSEGEQPNEIVLQLSPKLTDPSSINDMVIISCHHGNVTRYFASDSSVDRAQKTYVLLSIEEVIEKAIAKQKDVVIRYVKYDGEESERTLSNLRYASIEDNHSYMTKSHITAYCHLRDEERDFKVSRIDAIRFANSSIWVNIHE